jgi:hypothetical protein
MYYVLARQSIHAYTIHPYTIHPYTIHPYTIHPYTHTPINHTLIHSSIVDMLRIKESQHLPTVNTYTTHSMLNCGSSSLASYRSARKSTGFCGAYCSLIWSYHFVSSIGRHIYTNYDSTAQIFTKWNCFKIFCAVYTQTLTEHCKITRTDLVPSFAQALFPSSLLICPLRSVLLCLTRRSQAEWHVRKDVVARIYSIVSSARTECGSSTGGMDCIGSTTSQD